jgi:lipopolysaccharide export LptBFGC system permease protein LptF
MLQNKIYYNFIVEITKTFAVILFGLSIIALTVRAVNFLDLVVENGYPLSTYFKYSFLNFIGIVPKFIPFSFLIALTMFIIKHLQNNEFLILWTAGVKKIQIVNVFFLSSVLIFLLYLFFSTFLTPFSLNKSRYLLNQEEYNSILPTLKIQEFNDTFKGLIFFVENKKNNQLQNVFLQDKGNHFKNLSSNIEKNTTTNIIARTGLIENKKIILLNGQIISSNKNLDDEIIKFDQLNINLNNINTHTIKGTKIQETSTLKLISCLIEKNLTSPNCGAKNEIISSLNRRLVLPFYIPAISLIVSLLLINAKKFYLNRNLIFIYSFTLLIFTELMVRYTGINNYIFYIFLLSPVLLLISIYFILFNKFTNETI